jgi:hypothetical protein
VRDGRTEVLLDDRRASGYALVGIASTRTQRSTPIAGVLLALKALGSRISVALCDFVAFGGPNRVLNQPYLLTQRSTLLWRWIATYSWLA